MQLAISSDILSAAKRIQALDSQDDQLTRLNTQILHLDKSQ